MITDINAIRARVAEGYACDTFDTAVADVETLLADREVLVKQERQQKEQIAFRKNQVTGMREEIKVLIDLWRVAKDERDVARSRVAALEKEREKDG